MLQPSLSQDLPLPAPDRTGGAPLMVALNNRATSREFSDRELSQQQLSVLLWACWGINRPAEGRHTAPSSKNKQEMSVYVSMKNGLFLYLPETHALRPVTGNDLRKLTGYQDFVATAPVNLVYVADLVKAGVTDPVTVDPRTLNNSYINTGFMAQNVYLYCASEKLSCVVRGWFDPSELSKAMNLDSSKRIIITQTIGFPKQ